MLLKTESATFKMMLLNVYVHCNLTIAIRTTHSHCTMYIYMRLLRFLLLLNRENIFERNLVDHVDDQVQNTTFRFVSNATIKQMNKKQF